jgi:hypothetical protein
MFEDVILAATASLRGGCGERGKMAAVTLSLGHGGNQFGAERCEGGDPSTVQSKEGRRRAISGDF